MQHKREMKMSKSDKQYTRVDQWAMRKMTEYSGISTSGQEHQEGYEQKPAKTSRTCHDKKHD